MNPLQASVRLAENVWRVQIPMFPLYLLKGKKCFLIDSGVSALAPRAAAEIRKLLGNRQIDTLLLTHSHWDHVGGASFLQKRFGFSVSAASRTVELLEKEKVRHFINRLNRDYAEQIGMAGVDCSEKLDSLLAVTESGHIDAGDGHWFEVYAVPGHTRDSLAFLYMPEKILFPGDAAGVIEREGSVKPLFLSSCVAYERSLKKLISLNADMLCFAHNQVLRGSDRVKTFLNRSLERTTEIRERIRQKLKVTNDIDGIADALLSEEFPHPTVMGPREALLINLRAMTLAVQREFPDSV